MVEILKGAPVASSITEKLIERTARLEDRGVTPCIAFVRIGDRADDVSYENAAKKRCEKVGIDVREFHFHEDCPKEDLLDAIDTINDDESIHGCLMFRPLVDKDIESAACDALDPKKDVDGMTSGSLATVFSGIGDGYAPCTAQACIEILDHYGIDVEGKNVTVIGRSLVIGKPASMLLQSKNATVTMCHSNTSDLPSICKNADMIVVATGKPNMISKQHVSANQVVIDVGINVDDNGNICGDVDHSSVDDAVAAITPVPGGVGSVTTAVLCKHVVEAAEKAAKSAVEN